MNQAHRPVGLPRETGVFHSRQVDYKLYNGKMIASRSDDQAAASRGARWQRRNVRQALLTFALLMSVLGVNAFSAPVVRAQSIPSLTIANLSSQADGSFLPGTAYPLANHVAPNPTLSGRVLVSASDDSGITGMRLISQAQIPGVDRSVAAVLATRGEVSASYVLDTTLLPDGLYTIEVSGSSGIFRYSFPIANSKNSALALAVTSPVAGDRWAHDSPWRTDDVLTLRRPNFARLSTSFVRTEVELTGKWTMPIPSSQGVWAADPLVSCDVNWVVSYALNAICGPLPGLPAANQATAIVTVVPPATLIGNGKQGSTTLVPALPLMYWAENPFKFLTATYQPLVAIGGLYKAVDTPRPFDPAVPLTGKIVVHARLDPRAHMEEIHLSVNFDWSRFFLTTPPNPPRFAWYAASRPTAEAHSTFQQEFSVVLDTTFLDNGPHVIIMRTLFLKSYLVAEGVAFTTSNPAPRRLKRLDPSGVVSEFNGSWNQYDKLVLSPSGGLSTPTGSATATIEPLRLGSDLHGNAVWLTDGVSTDFDCTTVAAAPLNFALSHPCAADINWPNKRLGVRFDLPNLGYFDTTTNTGSLVGAMSAYHFVPWAQYPV